VGIPRELVENDEIAPRARKLVEDAAASLLALGARVDGFELPEVGDAIAIYSLLANAEASSNLARYEGVRFGRRDGAAETIEQVYARTRASGFGPEVKRRILLGTFTLSSQHRDEWFDAARRARRRLTDALDRALDSRDLLLSPTTPDEAFREGERLENPLAMYRSDLCTLPASLGGHPAISIPGPRTSSDELPLGVQLIGRRGDEETLLAAACALEDGGFCA
jgi:aspartyl-tRNA(Asn)/glutamyl-tRNA(Gln) amidotransferase subunit A